LAFVVLSKVTTVSRKLVSAPMCSTRSHQMSSPRRRWLTAILVAIAAGFARPANAGEAAASDSWTAVTVGRSSWGAAASRSLDEAIALAIGDCGAEIKTIKAGYLLAERCGTYRALVSGDTPEHAQSALAHRMLQLRYVSNARLGACVRILELQVPASSSSAAEFIKILR
jgi:hypothetical protein